MLLAFLTWIYGGIRNPCGGFNLINDGKIICKRCLLADMAGDEHVAHIFEYINSLPDNIKASEDLRGERLSHCRNCDNLVNGMCKHCGCYVEVRTAKINQSCPNPVRKW